MGVLTESYRFKELVQKNKEPITEGFFKDLLNSLFGNESESKLEQTENLDEIKNLLEFNGILNSEISDLLEMIVNHPNAGDINFGILGRTMSNVLLKKGDKTNNVKKYLNKIVESLNKRDAVIHVYPRSKVSKKYKEIALKILGQEPKNTKG